MLNRTSEYLDALRKRFPRLPLFSVRPDHYQAGRIQGRQFKLLLPHGGEVFYIQGPLWVSAAEKRYQGVQEELRGSPIDLVTFRSDWTESGGLAATHAWIQTVKSGEWSRCLVGAQNDAMAIGARQALLRTAEHQQEPRIAAIRITGCDGLPSHGRRWVAEGFLAATVTVPPTAGRALRELVSSWDSGEPAPPEIVLGVSSFPALEQLERAAQGI